MNTNNNKWRAFAESKWATLLLTVNAVFSVFMLVAMAVFVDDVASTLAIYFELGAAEKWQIVGKFSTPILIAVASLLLFNAIATLICLYYSLLTHKYIDSLIKNINLTLIGEPSIHTVKGFSSQTTTLANKLTQLQKHITLSQAEPALANSSSSLPAEENDNIHDAS